eukprot:4429325-Heterocapsa_arctica.AAC.1
MAVATLGIGLFPSRSILQCRSSLRCRCRCRSAGPCRSSKHRIRYVGAAVCLRLESRPGTGGC